MASALMRWIVDPRKNWLASLHMKIVANRLHKVGLRYDDLYDPMYDLDIKEALNRLPREIVDARNQRLKRAMDLSMKHEYIPEDLQLIAEVLGTYFVIFAGCAAVVVNTNNNKVVSLPGISIVWGLVVMVMVYAVGHISGAHFNPAVTIAFATCKKFPWKQAENQSQIPSKTSPWRRMLSAKDVNFVGYTYKNFALHYAKKALL